MWGPFQGVSDQLSPKGPHRPEAVFATDDPTSDISAAWACKELLRQLLAAHGPTDPVQPARDRPPADPVPRRVRRRGHARDDPPGGHDRIVVAPDRRSPRTRCHQRQDRGLQPRHQADQARRLRLPEPGQLRKTPHVAQRSPTGRVNHQQSRSTSSTPPKCKEPPRPRWRAPGHHARSPIGRYARCQA